MDRSTVHLHYPEQLTIHGQLKCDVALYMDSAK